MDAKKLAEVGRLIAVNPSSVAARLAELEGITRQAASARLASLKNAGVIAVAGNGRGVKYALLDTVREVRSYPISGLSEDWVWREQCAPVVKDLPENVRGIWHHGVTEMVNNAIDHSGSTDVQVGIARNALSTKVWVSDHGEGIFLRIQRALNLYDARESILELAKGKFTTDPANHSGEGIFFSSKMFDHFSIRSGALFFMHDSNQPDVLFEKTNSDHGTLVVMELENDSERTTREVFDQFALPEEFSFAKTIVPVRLAQHEGEKLVSRSQAKRLTRRFERFQTVILDFSGVEEIGQAFADEVFRVFQNAHPQITMAPIKATEAVTAMISRARIGLGR
ncbi:MAG: DUF4325 domain-containing protein [Burkholderiaceae bacterium]|nr:DUF4325 domain-containing protein [Burkholderiaceae bacterium]